MPASTHALPGERLPAPSGQVLPFRPHRHAQLVQVLVHAVRHRDRAAARTEGAMRSVEALVANAARAGSLDLAGVLGLQLTATGLRVAMEELAAAHLAVEAAAVEASDA